MRPPSDELSNLNALQEPRVAILYDFANSYVRKEIDNQLADLLKELDKPRTPFGLSGRLSEMK